MIALASIIFVAWSWFTAVNLGFFYLRAILIFPAFAVVGIALILFPGYKEERLARGEDISRLKGPALITARWWIVLAVGFVATAINYWLIR